MNRLPSTSSSPETAAAAPRRSLRIAMRIALLSWLVTLTTLTIFMLVTIPQEKRFFMQSLESKANGVAVSLHDVAAGAAVNEDFASVVSAAQTLLGGDPDIAFLIITKNDGFSLSVTQNGWSAEPKTDAHWYVRERVAVGEIHIHPQLNERLFHFAQPFDYSGIQWGWIHVGLSLKGYDHSVAMLYRNTLLLAVGCILFSLLVSLLYAQRLVRPILHLQQVVQRVTGGDLSARADRFRHDELGTLAESVNVMTEALLRRDLILESVRFAAQRFLETPAWEQAVTDVLARIGRAAIVSRAYIFVNHTDESGRLFCSLAYEWAELGIDPQLPNPELQQVPYELDGLDRWRRLLGGNQILCGQVAAMSPGERAILEPQGIVSLIVIPIFVGGQWWGFMGLDDCRQNRAWTDAEKDSLRAGADMLGATIIRQRMQKALMEAKATLEQRVEERTQELKEQITAKEQALAELAAAQSTLLEVSRAAGMAEVATGVLHNVGNVLNSVNVSCTILMDQLRESRIGNVTRIADLLADPEGGLPHFLTEDARGRQIPVYLASLAGALRQEHQVMFKETESLQSRLAHIKEIVTMQQSYGRVSGVQETIQPAQLMEDALKLNAGALARHGVTVRREYQPVGPITVDKHAVLQILLNLINNAKYACTDSEGRAKSIILKIGANGSDRLRMQVVDNGIGILPENMARIFQHGFTTRKSGHGFGLHSGALAARELGGSLNVHSDGPGTGATFTLELPYRSGERK